MKIIWKKCKKVWKHWPSSFQGSYLFICVTPLRWDTIPPDHHSSCHSYFIYTWLLVTHLCYLSRLSRNLSFDPWKANLR